ncbi:MAG TPA: DUF2834 domain-containing protein [Noviherbaspirillum sp.]|nr:DUF2834 domain-containing protein [Noviherbaspirillum sp.]
MQHRTATMYYVLAAIGLIATWYFNVQFFLDGGSVAPDSFFGSALANALTTAITVDIYWAALVFSTWAVLERSRAGSPSPWLYIALCFGVGLAFAFPLYLGRRAQLLARGEHGVAPNNSSTPAPLRGTA